MNSWSELSSADKVFSYGIAKSSTKKVAEIREVIGWESNKIGPYRKRLNERGLINTSNHGYISFFLPYFDEFIIEEYEESQYYG